MTAGVRRVLTQRQRAALIYLLRTPGHHAVTNLPKKVGLDTIRSLAEAGYVRTTITLNKVGRERAKTLYEKPHIGREL